jgi:hypothetical protein
MIRTYRALHETKGGAVGGVSSDVFTSAASIQIPRLDASHLTRAVTAHLSK